MNSPAQPRSVIDGAIRQLLRPLFRLLLRHGVSYRAFETLARQSFVQVALDDFTVPGRKPSISRVSILSGLTRKEVQRLLAADPAGPAARGDRTDDDNRAARVLTGWLRDAAFHAPDGQPRALEATGAGGFAGLVRRYSGDMPARAVLDELLRAGAVRQRDDGRIELLGRGYIPRHSVAEKLRILGADVADLIETIDHNVQHGDADPRFQRKVVYRSLPADALPAFRRYGSTQSQALLERLDRWLAARDTDNPPDDPQRPRVRVGVGIYQFEAPAAAPIPDEDPT